MKYLCFYIFSFSSFLLSGWNEKEDFQIEPSINCTDLTKALLERDYELLRAVISPFLQHHILPPSEKDQYGHAQAYVKIIEQINACPTMEVVFSCYYCIETLPPFSEIAISLTFNDQVTEMAIHLQPEDNGDIDVSFH